MSDIAMHPTLFAALERALEAQSVNQWREIAEQTRDYMVAALDPKGDQDILHGIRETHIAFGAACAFNAARELQGAVEHARKMDELFEAVNAANLRAIKRWQEAHPGNDLVWPDGAKLIVWLMDQLTAIERTTHAD